MPKVTIIIDEESFDKQIGNMIKEKVKNVLRNDKFITAVIRERIDEEVEKRVKIASTDLDEWIKTEAGKKVQWLTTLAKARMASELNTTIKELNDAYNTRALKQLLAKEAEEIRSSSQNNQS